MLRPSTTSISSAQADGQSCGQVEWRISILACWFMTNFVTSNDLRAEGIYPAMPMQNAQTMRAACSCRDCEMLLGHTENGPIFLPESTL